jgi:hypothetical protein
MLLIPTAQELIGFLNLELMLDEAVHPEDMIVLPL